MGVAGVVLAGCVRFEDKPLSAAGSAQELETRSLGDLRFRAFLETNLQHTFTAWPLTNLDFPALTLAAFYFHPNLDLARAQWAVARGGEVTAGARPNPVLSVVPGYSANAPKGVSPWFPSVTLDIPIETAGKRGHRLAHAQQMSEAARLNITTTAWQVRSGVRAALDEFIGAQIRANALANLLKIEEAKLDLLEKQLTAGATGQLEVTPTRLALIKLRGEIAAARTQAEEARGKIAESIGLPLGELRGVYFPVRLPRKVDPALEAAAGEFATNAPVVALRRAALVGRADVLAALAEYASSQSALQLEIAKQYPDLHFNPGYQYDQGENKWSLGLSVELPVLYRNQGGIAEAKAKRDESAARFLALQVKVIAETDRALQGVQLAGERRRQAAALRSAADDQSARLDAALRAGAADRLEVLAAESELALAEVAFYDALAKEERAFNLLEDALQRPFEALSTVERDPKTQAANHP